MADVADPANGNRSPARRLSTGNPRSYWVESICVSKSTRLTAMRSKVRIFFTSAANLS